MTPRPDAGNQENRLDYHPVPIASLLIFTSAVLIAFEFLIVRLFSHLYWGDFGYFSIAVAMFGFSLSGVLIAYLRARKFTFSLPFLGIISVLTSLTLFLTPIFLSRIPFQPVLIFHSAGEFVHLLGFGFLLAVPFLIGYFLIGVLLTERIEKIGFYYGLNLGGAALGGVLFTLLLSRFSFPVQFKILALLLLVPPVFLPGRWKKLVPAALAAGIVILPFPDPVPSDFKDIAQARNVPEYERIEKAYTPSGIITVLSSNYFRNIPGLSLNYSGELKGQYRYFQNGDSRGRLPLTAELSRLAYLEYLPSALPYLLRDFDRSLYLSTGGGGEWLKAFYFGSGTATVTVADPSLRRTVKNLARGKNFYGIDPGRVRLIGAGGRETVEITSKPYDLIEISRLGGGGYRGGMRSDYLLTRQGLESCLKALSENGALSLTFSIHNPPRAVPRMLRLLRAVGDELGLPIEKNLLISRGWNTASFLYLKGGLSEKELETARDFWESRSFDPVYFPGMEAEEANRRNLFAEPYFYRAARLILGGDRFRSDYFDLSVPTDNRPYFHYFTPFFRAFDLFRENRDLALNIVSFDEMMTFLNLGVCLVLGVIFLVFPAGGIIFGKKRDVPFSGALYFLAIGFGFLFIELLLIQKLNRFTGDYLISFITVLAGMLVAAGAGSWLLAPRVKSRGRFSILSLVFLLLLFLPLNFMLEFGRLAVSHPVLHLVLAAVFGLATAVCMGVFFPRGMAMAEKKSKLAPAWMWSFNGLASVIAPAAETVISIRLGFTAVAVMVLVLYGTASLIYVTQKPPHPKPY